MVEFHFEAAVISQEGFMYLRNTNPEIDGPNCLVSFLYMDFFEFESEITPIGIGLKPFYNHTSRYTLYVDDFFLAYLQSQAVTIHLCRSNGIEFTHLGYWHVDSCT